MTSKKNNISKFNTCYGCGVCVIACPVKIIDYKLNNEGFYVPVIHEMDKCINCGICLDICAYNHTEIASPPIMENVRAWGCRSRNSENRKLSTTGAMGYEIAIEAIKRHNKVCSVRYDLENNRAEHYIATNISELNTSRGTKYIPSFTITGFNAIGKNDLFTIFGLPCQIDSLRRYIRRFKLEDKIRLIDLFCYGVPSLLLWHRYIKETTKDIGHINNVIFRSKKNGWHHSSCIEIDGSNQTYISKKKDDPFFGLFFRDCALNSCCYNKCKYKLCSSSADVRIGDFWGEKYATDEEGVNVLFSLTAKGNEIVEELQSTCEFEEVSILEATAKQKHHNAKLSPFRSFVIWGLNHKIPLAVLNRVVKYGRILINPKRLIKN